MTCDFGQDEFHGVEFHRPDDRDIPFVLRQFDGNLGDLSFEALRAGAILELTDLCGWIGFQRFQPSSRTP